MRFHKLEEYLRTRVGREMLGIGMGSADFAQLVRDAQKFYVGDVCLLGGIRYAEDLPRLPYQLCLFEFQANDPDGVKKPFFVLAEEVSESAESGAFVRCHSFIPYADLWLHSGYVEVIRATNTYDSFVNKKTLQFLASRPTTASTTVSVIEHSIMVSTQWLFRFLSVLNCTNVEVSEVAEPKFLNKKRARNGKVPIYSYKTLVLKTRQQRFLAGNGTHESPRIHLRRGHIKRRRTGNFWWEPCVVGDRKRGVVIKDYRANGLLEMVS